ncbi:AraC family transcriptional regulator [Halodesulfovibrio sp.]|jgi:AraC-like DNA-binding protein|uniref:helix-turn-helix domain-containing protein n=1 Tax=Halodesulfovibrio sp. TaxID=1912772 RepID=UPI0025D6BFE0|nr:AraC family transcriptional regulator [Halodesulfovibrio sp.]MCT4535875.1 AraC family transcriptional regulator [Halodesulfovibrio sp.]
MPNLLEEYDCPSTVLSKRQVIENDMQMVIQRGEGAAEIYYEGTEQTDRTVEVCFNLGGNIKGMVYGESGCHAQNLEHGQAHIAYYSACSGHVAFCPKSPIFCIAFMLSEDLFERFFDTSLSSIREQMYEDQTLVYSLFSPITADMKLALSQLVRCPFLGKAKGMFLEGKAMELATHLRQVAKKPVMNMRGALTAADYGKMWEVKNILDDNLESPPSITELAGITGVNECKLKNGFKQVHGVTPYRYIADHRLEEARCLLCEKKANVSEAAFSVGYSSLSHFSKIFREKYGVTPQEYMVSVDTF